MIRLVVAIAIGVMACGDNASSDSCTGAVETLYSGAVWGWNLAIDGGEVYFTTFPSDELNDHAVRAVSTCGGAPRVVWHGAHDDLFGSGLVLRDGLLYWTQMNGPGAVSLFRAPQGGGDRTMLADLPSFEFYANFAGGADAAYVPAGGGIVSAPLAGGPTMSLVSLVNVNWITSHNGSLYVTSNSGLTKIDPTTGVTVTIASLPLPLVGHAFDVDDEAAYLPAAGAIARYPLAGGAPTLISTSDGSTPSIVIKAPDAYYVDLVRTEPTQLDRIARIPPGGGPPEILVDHLTFVAAMALDHDALYVAQCACSEEGKILRIPL